MKISLSCLTFALFFNFACSTKEEKSTGKLVNNADNDTSIVIKGNLLSNPQIFASRNTQIALQRNGLAAMDIPTTIKIDAKNWVNNLEQIVGRIIRVEKIDTNSYAEIRPLRSLITNYDSLKKAIKIPLEAESELIEKSFKRDKIGELGFLGINLNINNNQEYRYKQSEILNLTVRDSEIDTTRVPKQYRCANLKDCNYYYVLTASVNRVETSLFTLKGRSVSASDLSGFGVVKSVSGKIQLSDEKRDIRRHYVLFLTLIDLRTLFDS